MKTCRLCGATALLIPTGETREVPTISASLEKVVLRPCPVFTHDELCYFHRKVADGLLEGRKLDKFWKSDKSPFPKGAKP